MTLMYRAGLLAALACVSLLAGCGGGGGSDAQSRDGNALPLLVQDVNPGAGISIPDLFPMALGDYTTSDVLGENGELTGTLVTQSVVGSSGAVFSLEERTDGVSDVDRFEYIQTAQGLAQTGGMFADTPQAAMDIIGQVLIYPNTLYPTGSTRQAIRQGNWGEDLDGDGKNESFRFELTQQVLGEETITVPISSTPVQALHFRTVLTQRIQPTKAGLTAIQAKTTVDDYVLRGVGIVRSQKSYEGLNVTAPPSKQTLLKSAKAAGVQFGPVLVDKSTVTVNVSHERLVYAPGKNMFLAGISVNSSDPHAGAVALIDGATGQIKGYSSVLSPGRIQNMAVSSDGAWVYVAMVDPFTNSYAILKMALVVNASTAALTEQARLTLPLTSLGASMYPVNLAVSPVDPALLVLGISSSDASAAGLYVVRDLVLGAHVPAQAISMAFSADGATLISFDEVNFTASQVSRHQIANDTLVTVGAVPMPGGSDLVSTPDVALGRAYIANRWFAFDDLSTGSLARTSCRVLSGASRLACLDPDLARNKVRLLNASSGDEILARLIDIDPVGSLATRLVPGDAGTLAISLGDSQVVIVRDPQLQ